MAWQTREIVQASLRWQAREPRKNSKRENWIMNNPRDLLQLHLEVVCKQWAHRHWHRRGNCITAPRHTIFMITFSDHVHINNAWKAVWVREVCWFDCCVPVSPHSRAPTDCCTSLVFPSSISSCTFTFFPFCIRCCTIAASAIPQTIVHWWNFADSWPNNRYLIDGKKSSQQPFLWTLFALNQFALIVSCNLHLQIIKIDDRREVGEREAKTGAIGLKDWQKEFCGNFDENFGLCRPVCSANGIVNSGVEERN